VRYPSGQLVLTKLDVSPSGAPSSGPRDVVGVFTSESEAQNALAKLRTNIAGIPRASTAS
jgi:hypothetical protein